MMLTNGLILSKILYLLPLYGTTHEKYLRKIQVIMNKAIRFVTGLNKRTKTRKLMEEVGWLTVHELQEYHALLLTWRILRLRAPEYLARKFHLDKENRISTSHPRLQNTAKSFRWKTVGSWNRLRDVTRGELSYQRFKRSVRREIVDRRPP